MRFAKNASFLPTEMHFVQNNVDNFPNNDYEVVQQSILHTEEEQKKSKHDKKKVPEYFRSYHNERTIRQKRVSKFWYI